MYLEIGDQIEEKETGKTYRVGRIISTGNNNPLKQLLIKVDGCYKYFYESEIRKVVN